MSYSVSGIKVWAVLAIPFLGASRPLNVTVDIIQFTADFELNAIPKATLVLALGRLMTGVNKAAQIHTILSFLKLRVPVTVYMQATLQSDDNIAQDDWPKNPDGSAKTFKIFEGYTTGSGYNRTMQGADFTLFSTHWLEDLNFSSALSRLFQPLSPQQYSFPQVLPDVISGNAANLIGTTAAQDIFNSAVVRADFWGLPDPGDGSGGLKTWFTQLSNKDLINAREIFDLSKFGGAGYGQNTEALAALARMEPFTLKPYVDGVPLSLDTNEDIMPQVSKQIADFIGAEQFESLGNHTLWDKLVGLYAPNFMFSVVPMVEKTLVVPFIPGLRTEFITIYATEYDHIQLFESMPRMTRAVALMMGAAASAGGVLSGNTGTVYKSVGGWFEGRPSGTILVRECPHWLANVAMPYLDSRETVGIDAAIPSALSPETKVAASLRALDQLMVGMKTLWDKYAQTLYMNEILRGRYGTLSGKLRFDIAPGSTVRIEGADDLTINGAFKTIKYGHVLRVSIAINAETQRAGTAFHIAYIRDEAENADDATSIARHPLWKDVWTGAPLANLD